MANTAKSDLVAARVRELMTAQDMKVKQLAARCDELGMPELTVQALYKFLGQRDRSDRYPRPVTVDELYVLAEALRCTPEWLLGESATPSSHGLRIPSDDLGDIITGLQNFRSALDAGIVRSA